jgi:3-oxoacyl-[acyl-carrier-protein] synthase III
MIDARVRAAGLVSGWGKGVGSLPADAGLAADGRGVIAATPTPRAGDRLRRATRECRLAIDAVDDLLEEGGLARDEIAGDGTALVYVTAAAYGASNRAFVEGGGGALHFPYTAPSAVPAEVAIEFGLHGPYAVLIGGAATTLEALEHAATLLRRGACARALVLGVETFVECADLHARGRWLIARPLLEAAAAVLLEPAAGGDGPAVTATDVGGDSMACMPLIALAVSRAGGGGTVSLTGRWRGRATTLTLGVVAPARRS